MALTHPTSRSILVLFVIVAASSIYRDLVSLLREFNFDIGRMLTKMVKHPWAWVPTARIAGISVAAFIIWLGRDDEELLTTKQYGLVAAVALLLGLVYALLLLLYLRLRRKEQMAQR